MAAFASNTQMQTWWVILHGGKVVWVELKSKGKKPTKIQTIRQNELVSMGHEVYTIDNKQTIDELIKVWRTEK